MHGVCPDCGLSTRGHGYPPAAPLGALCYSDTGQRVVPCACGSFAMPVPPDSIAGAGAQLAKACREFGITTAEALACLRRRFARPR